MVFYLIFVFEPLKSFADQMNYNIILLLKLKSDDSVLYNMDVVDVTKVLNESFSFLFFFPFVFLLKTHPEPPIRLVASNRSELLEAAGALRRAQTAGFPR